VILLVVVVLFRSETLRSQIAGAGRLFTYVVLVGGALLAWRFHRSRVVFALLVLAIAVGVVGNTAAADPSLGATAVGFHGLALLLPLNLLGISLLGERGVLTRPGLARVTILALQVGALSALAVVVPATTADWLQRQIIPVAWTAWTPIAQPALVAYGLATSWMGVRLVLHPGGATRGFLWALITSFLALHAFRDSATATTYLGTAGLILGVGVIEATYFMAFRDQLTGLPARRAFNGALLELGSQYTVAMVDVDRFKKFNDQHGHDVGDQVLKMVARELGQIAGGGTAYRYGGEEFAIVFPGKRRDDCVPHLEQVREAVEGASFTVRGRGRPRTKPAKSRTSRRPRGQLSVTVSIGVAERNGRYPTPEKVVKAADQALYRAKKAGRNRIRR
jgi:diguanylate cyclase (GGDEF)-like protein